MKFEDFVYEEIVNECAELIKEGGNAIAGVDRIQLENIKPTIEEIITQYIEPIFGHVILGKQIFLLGSTGKKESSGDLDLGVDLLNIQNEMTIESAVGRLYEYIREDGTNETKINEFTKNMVHFGFPQYNEKHEQIGKTVQVDVLFTVTPDFCKFYMYSPSQTESSYKGAHRNDLLRAIAKFISFQVIELDQNGEPVQWIQLDLSSSGVHNDVKTLIDDNGNRLKYGNTDEDLETGYAVTISSKPVTDDPNEAIEMLVGNYSIKDIDTFEKLLNIIENDKNFKYAKAKERILQKAALLIKENNRLDFPVELEKYL